MQHILFDQERAIIDSYHSNYKQAFIYCYCAMKRFIIFDVRCCYVMMWQNVVFVGFKDCPTCSHICLYPLSHFIHITDNYLSKIPLCEYIVRVPISIPSILSTYQGFWSKIKERYVKSF